MTGRIVQHTPGRWQLIFDLPRGADGKRKQRYVTVKGTRKEAEKELRRLLNEIDSGLVVDSTKDSMPAYLNKWLSRIKGKVEATTYDGYETVVRAHLAPYFARKKLEQLKPEDVADFITFLEREGNQIKSKKTGERKGTPLAGITVFRIGSVLKQALEDAVDLGLLARNPAKVKLPKPTPKRKRILRDEDMLIVVQGVRDAHLRKPGTERSYLHMLIVLGLATGCRRGELLSLRWSDVNLKTGVVTIDRSLSEVNAGEGKKLKVKGPKTESGSRTVVLPPFALRALAFHKGEQAKRRLLLGNRWHDLDLIICGDDGRALRPSTVSQRMKQMMDFLGYERVTLHGLRHTYASMAINNGANLKTLQTILGHANVQVTIGTYGHLMGGEQAEVARGIEERIGKAMGL